MDAVVADGHGYRESLRRVKAASARVVLIIGVIVSIHSIDLIWCCRDHSLRFVFRIAIAGGCAVSAAVRLANGHERNGRKRPALDLREQPRFDHLLALIALTWHLIARVYLDAAGDGWLDGPERAHGIAVQVRFAAFAPKFSMQIRSHLRLFGAVRASWLQSVRLCRAPLARVPRFPPPEPNTTPGKRESRFFVINHNFALPVTEVGLASGNGRSK